VLHVLRDPGFEVTENAYTEAGRKVMKKIQGSIQGAAFSPDGKRVATVGGAEGRSENALRLWDVRTGRVLRTLVTNEDALGSQLLWLTPDRILTLYDGRRACLWDAETGKVVARPEAQFRADLKSWSSRERIFFGNFVSPGGRLLAGVGPGHTLVILDGKTGNQLVVGKGHARPIRQISFSADGRRIVTAAEDDTVRVWDAASGKEEVTLTGHRAAVLDACFSSDGRRVASAAADGTVRVWQLDLMAAALAARPRELTAEERARFEVDGMESK
jgi:WD40 repeat protein